MQVLSERTVAEVEDGYVAVRKSVLDLARENIVGIKLAIRSEADTPVAIRLAEEFPGHVSMSDIQAHPSYYPERWTVSEGRHLMTFESELHPGESIETLYGVRVTDGDMEPFVGEPSLDTQPEHPEPADGEANEPASDAAESPDAETDATDPEGAPASATVDPEGESFEFGEDRDRAVATAPGGAGSSPIDKSVDALIEAVERSALSADQLARLRAAIDDEPAESRRIQLDRLQASVARLSAYADEFERFVDAVGSPADVIEELRTAREELEAAVEAADADREDLRARQDRLEADLRDDLEVGLERLEAEQAALREDLAAAVDDLDARLDADVASEVDDLDDRVRELEAVLGAEEFEDIREVIAAERAWRQRRAASRAGQPVASASGPAER